MANAGNIKLEVNIDIGKANKDLKKIISVLNSLEKEGADLNKMSKSFDNLEKEIKQTTKATNKYNDASKKIGDSSGKQKKGISGLGASLGGYAMAAQAAIGAIRGMISASQDFIKEADNHDMAQGKLTQGLQNVNNYSRENIALLNKQSMALSKLTGFQGDEITHAQGMLTTFGQTTDQIEELTPRILDMAASMKKAGKDMDVQQIAIAMGKAFTSGAGALSRYGVVMTEAQKEQFKMVEGMDKTRLMAEILDNNFAGMAESTATNTEKMASRWNDFQVAIGGILQEIQGDFLDDFLPVLETVVEWITKNSSTIVKVIKVIGAVLKSFVKTSFAQISFFIKTWQDMAGIVGEGSVLISNTVQELKKIIVDVFKSMLTAAKDFGKIYMLIATGQFGKVKDAFNDMKDNLSEGFGDVGERLGKVAEENTEFVKKSFGKMGENAKQAFFSPMTGLVEDIANIVTDVATIEPTPAGGTGGGGGNGGTPVVTDTVRRTPELMGLEKLDAEEPPVLEKVEVKKVSINPESMSDMQTQLTPIIQNMGESLGSILDSTIGTAIDALVEGGQSVTDIFNNLSKELAKMALSAAFKALLSIATGGAGTGFGALLGGAIPGFAGGTEGYANGGSFQVPDGFPNDSFKIGLTSDEIVTVSQPGEGGSESVSSNFNFNFSGVFPTKDHVMARYVDKDLKQAFINSNLFDKG